MIKKTSLFKAHQALGAHIVEFANYYMPLYYSSIAKEHQAVREKIGMFDVSHMGQIWVKGKDALAFCNHVLTANITVSDRMIYSLLCKEDGNIIDDVMIYPFSDISLLLVVNASNIKKDYDWLTTKKNTFDVSIIDDSDTVSEIALQGPRSYEVLATIFNDLPRHSLAFKTDTYLDETIYVSRSGYTGEDGFEIYLPNSLAPILWEKLIGLDVTPCGLGARDTLRFEAAMPLYGHEIDENINPLEANLNFAVDLTKPFIGRDALLFYKTQPKRKLVGLELPERRIARSGYAVYAGLEKIGYVTTGYLSITTGRPLALAIIDINYAKIGTNLHVSIRHEMVPVVIRNRKFYDKKNKVGE